MNATKYRLTPNLFGVSFGTAGLAQAWTAAWHTVGAAEWVGVALWVAAAALWVVTLVSYVANASAQGRLRTEVTHPTTGPFTSLIAIIPMLLGAALEPYAETAGKVVYTVGLVGTVALGSWITGAWIRLDMKLADWHPGYFLPTVAGGLIAAGGAAVFGWTRLAELMFGYGLVCWFVLGSILLLRLFTQPRLAPPLLPTMAIELAPPVVAGNVWFAMNGGRADLVATVFAGYAILMALVQVSLIPLYRTAPFGPPYWAFAFTYAAAVAVAIRWLAADDVVGRTGITYALLAVGSLAFAVLGARSVLALKNGTFLLRNPAPLPDPVS
ncbi:TDT family transporter [Streptomyces sp. NPDC059271]|uniref:SLAC1 family transporter n=1 Tax=Streptomyces sp. NPDC059271 TaxID=3346799 RepID=UPI0036CD48F4